MFVSCRPNRTSLTEFFPRTAHRSRCTTPAPNRSSKVSVIFMFKIIIKLSVVQSCSMTQDLCWLCVSLYRCSGRLQRHHLRLRTDIFWKNIHHGGTRHLLMWLCKEETKTEGFCLLKIFLSLYVRENYTIRTAEESFPEFLKTSLTTFTPWMKTWSSTLKCWIHRSVYLNLLYIVWHFIYVYSPLFRFPILKSTWIKSVTCLMVRFSIETHI